MKIYRCTINFSEACALRLNEKTIDARVNNMAFMVCGRTN